MNYVILIFSIFFLIGCTVSSDNPLSNFEKEKIDKSLAGVWALKKKKNTHYIHIIVDEKSKLFKIVMVEDNLDTREFSAHNTDINENNYLNVRFEKDYKDNRYFLFKYKVSSDELQIGMIEYEKVEKAISEKTLLGKLQGGYGSSILYITESQEKLQKFIKEHNSELFSKMTIFKKLKI